MGKHTIGKSFFIRNGKIKMFTFVRSNIKNIIVSIFISVLLLFVGYFTNNMSLLTGEKLGMLAFLETINRLSGIDNEDDTDSVIYINTTFDKALIPYYQTDIVTGNTLFPLGNTVITDREKLVKLLELLEGVNYKYLILDIRFAKGLESDIYVTDSITGEKVKVDEKLTSLINRLDRVVIPTHHGIRLINAEIERKAALADYKSTATATNFVRYEYYDSIPYIPLRVYNDLNKGKGLDTIVCHYPFGKRKWKAFAVYTQGHRICHNSLFLGFKIRNNDPIINDPIIEDKVNPYQHVDFLNLSADILDEGNREYIVKDFENKLIIVGDHLQDMHDTYAGLQPGGVILYNAIKALNDNKHVISVIEIIILFFLYFIISLFILCGKNIFNFIKKSDNPLLHFIIDTASFTIILIIYQIVEYMLGRTSYSFVIPVIIFTILKTYILLKEKYNMKKNLFVLFLALLLGLLMSFSYVQDGNEGAFKVHTFNSDLIYIDGKKVFPGMIITPNSQIKFMDSRQWVKLLNVGDDYTIRYGKNNEMTDVWKKGQYRTLGGYNASKKANLLLWWIKYNMTSTKGGGSLFDDVEYLIGDKRVFEIEYKIINPAEQEYKFDVIEGRNNGKFFYANPDDEDMLIWLSRDVLKKYDIVLDDDTECDSLKVNVIYRSFSETDTLKKSMILKIINL